MRSFSAFTTHFIEAKWIAYVLVPANMLLSILADYGQQSQPAMDEDQLQYRVKKLNRTFIRKFKSKLDRL